jgi:hypothetical protein
LSVSPSAAATSPQESARTARAQLCGSHLQQINLAKEMWKTDNKKPDAASPTVSDLTTYLPYRRFPKCPDGGSYSIGRINQKATCSSPGYGLQAGPAS